MRKLIYGFTLPVTLIIFGVITKWHYGLAIDAKDVFFYGFPLIYKCEGFHTSMSTQYFLAEMLVDFLTYFLIFFIITLIINRFLKLKISNKISKVFWIGFTILFLGFWYISIFIFDDRLKISRDFEVEIFDSGFTLLESNSTNREQYKIQYKKWSDKQK
jgi:hypothetical protein